MGSRLLERVGAHTLADRDDRERFDGDLVPVVVPPGPGAVRSHRFRMFAHGGRDQVVRAMRDGGWNAFEPPLPALFTQLVRHWPDTFFDVGANTGVYSLIAVTAHRHVRVHAVEALPDVAALLRANLVVNPASRRITVHEVAANDHEGAVVLHVPRAQEDGTIETSTSINPAFKDDIERRVEVVGRPLDALWSAAGRPATSTMKIDVEGAEAPVLAGAIELIRTCRPVIAVEVLTSATSDAADQLRREHDYVDVTLSPVEMVVNRKPVRPDRLAPNHLLVPFERLGKVVELTEDLRTLQVTLLS